MRVEGFERSRWPEGYFDLAISNVPFGNYGVRDSRYRHLSIHDYFFVKALDKVRPGGLTVFITSHYTLDKKADAARREIARRADFLGAIRLPGGENGAFKANAGTEVTADILFLRRRSDGEQPGEQSWLDLKAIETPDGPIEINRYFAENPAMMLGEMRLERGMHASPTPVLTGNRDHDLAAQIENAAQQLPKGAYRRRGEKAPRAVAEIDASHQKEGAYFIEGGTVFQRVAGAAEEQALSAADRAKLIALLEIRDTVNALLAPPGAASTEHRDMLRARLNRAYDRFVSRYGPINRTIQTVTGRLRKDGTPIILRRMPNFSVLRDDPDAFKVAALEDYDERQDTAIKTAIFTHDIIRDSAPPKIESVSDALAVSLNQTGGVDLAFIADALNIGEEEARDALGDKIWLDPAGDVWRTAADYLSGDAVQKLEDARIAAKDDARYLRNVEALERVQPAPLTRVDIRILCGAPWVPPDIYRTFLSEALSVPAEGLILSEISKKWQFLRKPEVPASAEAQYGTARAKAIDIIEAALNNGEIRIFDPGPAADSPPIFNAAASEEANAKVSAIRELFSGSPETGVEGWIWQDEERARRLEELYNFRFNRLVPTVYDGSHQTMPGLARFIRGPDGEVRPFKLAPHQLNVIWRVVSSGNTLIDHAVGAGKTFAMIGAGQEQRRLGLIRRPIYVVPNHMLEQFAREFLQAYPAAGILVADKDSMTKDRRRAFSARIAAGNYDAIIIGHDAFGRIRMSDAAYERFIRGELEELRDFKAKAEADEGGRSPTVKELEKAAKRLETKLDKLLNQERKDEGLTFEELGADFLFVDEAHAFKNLSFRTRHTRVKGISGAESQRATDLYLKISYLEEQRPGRAAVFATGTPVSNTIAEMYTMQRYLQRRLLAEYEIDGFDAWAATFGDIVTEVELAPSGRGFRTTRSFSKFVNIPELIALYSRAADTQTAEMLNLPRPKLKSGQVTVVETELSERELEIMEQLVQRAEAIKGKRSEAGGDNMLKVLGEGLRLATDIRLLDATAPINPHGKTAAAVERIAQIWREGDKPALCQIVFLDMGVPGAKLRAQLRESDDDEVQADNEDEENEPLIPAAAGASFNLYEDLRERLVQKGIPREEIAFIHEADNDIKKARLFAAVREAQVRILIGSTAKMGVGTNVQRQLAAMHHLDAPWRPADVEQRDGRSLRQGNLNPEIEIIRYITLRSLDAYRWQTLTRKANFIAQLRAGARGVRTAEDIDSPLPEAAMIKAAATGNPLIIEHAELSKELRELEAAKRGQERSTAAAKAAHERLKGKIAGHEMAIKGLSADAGQVRKSESAPFALALGDRQFSGRKPAGEAIKEALLSKAAVLSPGQSQKAFLRGQLQGFKLEAHVRYGANGLSYTVEIERE
ncbi:MAG: DEAD/DEAH box helicase family protein, partial [Rhodomicrobium sp.]|nr:DEAD/DEAH box helicase family protein [Rhodomicrobium sp.]